MNKITAITLTALLLSPLAALHKSQLAGSSNHWKTAVR
jgi:hypothetical protein